MEKIKTMPTKHYRWIDKERGVIEETIASRADFHKIDIEHIPPPGDNWIPTGKENWEHFIAYQEWFKEQLFQKMGVPKITTENKTQIMTTATDQAKLRATGMPEDWIKEVVGESSEPEPKPKPQYRKITIPKEVRLKQSEG